MPNKTKFILVLFSVLSAIIIIIATFKYGIGLTNDSLTYIVSSQNFLETFSFTNFDGSKFVEQPPLYPLLLSVLSILPISLYTSLAIFNAILYGIVIFMVGRITYMLTLDSKLSIIGAVFSFFSFTIFRIYILAWSETIFIFLIILFLYFSIKYEQSRNKSDLIVISIIICLATLTRYIGISLAIAYGFYLIVNKEKFKDYRQTLSFVAIACIPLVILLIINFAQTHTLAGQRYPSGDSLFYNISNAFLIMSNWIVPHIEIVGYIMIAPIIAVQTKKSFAAKYFNNLFFIFSVIFIILTIIISSLVAIDRISYRLLSPVYLPLLFFVIAYCVNNLKKHFIVKVILYLYLFCFVTFNSALIFNKIQDSIENGIGYNSTEIKENKLIQHIKSNTYNAPMYSNFAELLTLYGERQVKLTPREYYYTSIVKTNELNEGNWFNDDKIILVWFDKLNRDFYMYEKNDLLKNYKQTLIEKNEDGEIYILEKNSN